MNRTYRVVTFTYNNSQIEFDGRGINKPSPYDAIEAWKEDACNQAELSFPGDAEAVDRNQLEIYDMKNDLLEGRVAHSEFFDNYAALVEDFNNGIAVLCYDIQWASNRVTDLPTMLVVHSTMEEFEEGGEGIGEALSVITGVDHTSFKTEVIS